MHALPPPKPRTTKVTRHTRASRTLAGLALKEGPRDNASTHANVRKPDLESLTLLVENIHHGLPLTLALGGIAAETTVSRWIVEYPGIATAIKKAETTFAEETLASLRASPAGLWQRDAWLLERRFPHLFGLRAQINVDQTLTHRVEVTGKVCDQLSAGWKAFNENHVVDVEAETG